MSNGVKVVPIERIENPSRERFYQEYDLPQRPVVITGATSQWRAMSEWTHEWFRDRHGAEPVQLSVEQTHTKKVQSTTMAKYVDMILTGTDGGLYLDQFALGRIPALREDVQTPYAHPARRNVSLNLWLGPAGTFISLHKDNHISFDLVNNIFAQIRGRKRVVLVSPDEDARMYPRTKEQGAHWHSQVDYENPDFERFPLFRDVTLREAVLQPGDLVFIPGDYWHSLRSLDPSISVSCWWRVHRIADVAKTGFDRLRNPSLPADTIVAADVEEFGGVAAVSAIFDTDEMPPEGKQLIWSLMETSVRQTIDAWRQGNGKPPVVATMTVSSGTPLTSMPAAY